MGTHTPPTPWEAETHKRTPLYTTNKHTFKHHTNTRFPHKMDRRNTHPHVHHCTSHSHTLSLFTELFLIQTTSITYCTFHTHTLPTHCGQPKHTCSCTNL